MKMFPSDRTKFWNARIWREDRLIDGKTIHCNGV